MATVKMYKFDAKGSIVQTADVHWSEIENYQTAGWVIAAEYLASIPELLTPEQLSAKLQLARKTIKKWTLMHRLPGQVKCGGRWRYRRIEIEKAMLRGELLNKG